jgi:hypothetical protein
MNPIIRQHEEDVRKILEQIDLQEEQCRLASFQRAWNIMATCLAAWVLYCVLDWRFR